MNRDYIIHINGESTAEPKNTTFQKNRSIKISLDKQKVTITYTRTAESKKSIQDLVMDMITLKDHIFRDAYRKAILMHALTYSVGLKVDSISITIDGETTVLTKGAKDLTRLNEKDEGHFPYIFSMIEGVNLNLPKSWGAIADWICANTETESQNKEGMGYAYAAVCNYMESKSKIYEMDRFTSLWMAMNAYYNYIAKTFEEEYKKINNWSFPNVKSKVIVNGKEEEKWKDSSALWLLRSLIDYNISFPLKKSGFTDSEITESDYRVENEICRMVNNKQFEISELYSAAQEQIKKEPKLKLPSYAEKLNKYAGEESCSLYSFIICKYAYSLRNEYLHGSSPAMLVTPYNSYRMITLEVVNYFLDRFLRLYIPTLFDEEKMEKRKTSILVSGCKAFDLSYKKDKHSSNH